MIKSETFRDAKTVNSTGFETRGKKHSRLGQSISRSDKKVLSP